MISSAYHLSESTLHYDNSRKPDLVELTAQIHNRSILFKSHILAKDELEKFISYSSDYLQSHPGIAILLEEVCIKGDITVQFENLGKKSTARWMRDCRTIVIDLSSDEVRRLQSLVFELCNAANTDLNQLSYSNFCDSFEYAEKIETSEYLSITRCYQITLQGVKEHGWPVTMPMNREVCSLLEDAKRRSTAYNGYSHFLLNVKFHNDNAINLLSKNLSNRSISIFNDKLELKLQMEYDAKRHFPLAVIDDIRKKSLDKPEILKKYDNELKKIDHWFASQQQLLREILQVFNDAIKNNPSSVLAIVHSRSFLDFSK